MMLALILDFKAITAEKLISEIYIHLNGSAYQIVRCFSISSPISKAFVENKVAKYEFLLILNIIGAAF